MLQAYAGFKKAIWQVKLKTLLEASDFSVEQVRKQALEAMSYLRSEYDHVPILTALVKYFVGVGDFKQALELAHLIIHEIVRYETLEMIADQLAQQANFPQAL